MFASRQSIPHRYFRVLRRIPSNQPKTMTKTYAQVVKQIETLKQEAEKLRRGEIDGVIARIREAISFYNLSAADLGLALKPKTSADKSVFPGKRKKRKSAAAKAPAVVKYTNGMGGNWGGIGKRPTWLRDALAAGKSLSDFAVK
jgi:DNA-binding protein H-NS